MAAAAFSNLLLVVAFCCLVQTINGQGNGALRLWRNGATSPAYSSGRVHIYLNNEWGNICDDISFGDTEADVICHQLGYTGASGHTEPDQDNFGSDSLDLLIDDVDCSTSNYLVLLQCDYSTNILLCNPSDDVGVTCYTTRIWDSPYNGQIRLQMGDYSNQGLLEVYCNRQWGTVCDNMFEQTEADTACRQLGYTNAASYNRLNLVGNSSDAIWLNNVDCDTDTQPCLHSCQSCPSTATSNCTHTQDVTLQCVYTTTMSVSTQISTCNTSFFINIGGIIGGILAALAIICALIIFIPILICCLCGVGIGAACGCACCQIRKAAKSAPV